MQLVEVAQEKLLVPVTIGATKMLEAKHSQVFDGLATDEIETSKDDSLNGTTTKLIEGDWQGAGSPEVHMSTGMSTRHKSE